jgi:hypothetical protein
MTRRFPPPWSTESQQSRQPHAPAALPFPIPVAWVRCAGMATRHRMGAGPDGALGAHRIRPEKDSPRVVALKRRFRGGGTDPGLAKEKQRGNCA